MSSPQSTPPPAATPPAVPAPRDGETRWLEIRRQELLAFARHLQRVRRRQREQDDHIAHLERQVQERVEGQRQDAAHWAAEKAELEKGMAREVEKISHQQQALAGDQTKIERERTEWQDLHQAHLDQLHLDLEALRKGNERLRLDLEKLHKDNTQLRTQLQEQGQSASHAVDQESSRHEQQRRDFEEEIASLRKRLKDLETRQAPPMVPSPAVVAPPPPPIAAPPTRQPLAPVPAVEEEPPWVPGDLDPDDVLANLAPPAWEEEEAPAAPVEAVVDDDDGTDLVQCETELSHLVLQLTAERQTLETLMRGRPPEGDLPDTKQVDLTFQRQRLDRTRDGLHQDREKLNPAAKTGSAKAEAKPMGRIRGTLHGIRKWLGERS